QTLTWRSNRRRSSAGSASSKYAVTNSTSSLQVSSCMVVSLAWSRSVFGEIGFERLTDSRARAMQEHALIALADVKHLADIVGGVAFDIAQAYDALLAGGQPLDGRRDTLTGLAIVGAGFGQGVPQLREGAPSASVWGVCGPKALGRDTRLIA